MTTATFTGLVNIVTLLFALSVLYNFAGTKSKLEGKTGVLVLGGIVGLTGVLIMATPWELTPGVILDLRTILLSLSGFFFGFLPTAIAVVIISIFRISMGGVGVAGGIGVIIFSAGLGLGWRHLRKDCTEPPGWKEFFLFGMVVHLVLIARILMLPMRIPFPSIWDTGPVVMLIFPLGTAILGKFFSNQRERGRTEEALLESESRYRNLFDNSHAVMLLIEPERGTIADANSAACAFYGHTRAVLKEKRIDDVSARSPEEIRAIGQKIKSQEQSHFESRHRMADGKVRDVEVFSAPIRLHGRTLIHFIIHDISARKAAEKALKQSEERYRLYLEHAPCGLLVLNNRAEMVELNDAFCQMSGYRREEMLGREVSLFSPQDDPQAIARYFKELQTTGRFSGINRYSDKQNAIVWRAVNGVRLGDDAFILFVVDMTEEKRLESLAHEREKELSRAQRMARLGSWEIDLKSGMYRPSAEARAILGLDDRDVTLEELKQLNSCEDQEFLSRRMDEHVRKGGLFEEEYSIRRVVDGEIRNVHTLAEFDSERNVILGTVQDVTDLRKAEDYLRESEALFRSLVEHSPDAIYVITLDGRFNYVNHASLRLFGAGSEVDLLGRRIFDCIHPDYHPHIRERLRLISEGRKDVPPLEEVYLRLDGSKVDVEAFPVPIRFRGKDGALLIVRDISERNRAVEALRQERDLFSAGPVFTIGWLPEKPWPVIQVSSNVREILGYAPEEMMDSNFRFADLIHPADLAGVAHEVADYLGRGVGSYEQDYRLRNKAGDYRWFHDFSRLVRNERGDIVSIRGYMIDLTRQKEAEQKLAEKRQRLTNVIDGTNAGTWEWNVRTGETVFNEKWAQIVGYSLSELEPVSIDTWLKLSHPDDLEESNSLLKKHFAGETDYYEYECRMRHKEGHWVWVRDCGRVLSWTDDGKPLYMSGTHMDITKRKRAEEALREREATLAGILRTVPIAVVLLKDRRFVWVNQYKLKMTGYSEEELVGKGARLLYENDAEFERIEREGYGSISEKGIGVVEGRWKRQDGTYIDVLMHLAALNPADLSEGIIGAALDISAQKKSREMLRDSEATLKSILKAAPAGIAMFRERTFVWASSGLLEMTGFAEEDLIGKNTRFLYPSDEEYERVGELGYEPKPGHDVGEIESRWTRKDGSAFDALVHLAPLNPDDKSEGYIGAILDISARKRSEELLRASEATYRTLFNVSVAAISVQNMADLSFIDGNPHFLEVYGYSFEELPSLRPVHFGTLDEEADPEFCESLRRRVMAGEIVNAEINDRKKGGDVILMGKSIRKVNLNGIDRIMTVAQDITERKMMREIMVQTEKIMSLGGLAAGMAHEINNPLSIILQGIQNINRRLGEPLPANLQAAEQCGIAFEALKEYFRLRNISGSLEAMHEAGERAARIVENMLDFSRKNDTFAAPQELNRILEKAIALARTDYDLKKKYDFRNMEIRVDLSPLPEVSCVETEIEQVILNLLRNAGQSLHDAQCEKPLIQVRTHLEEEWVVIEVEDNGPGMSPEVCKQVFEPFYTTKQGGEGTGLGLSVSYHIIAHRHQGEMTVESKPGYGACFRIRLPLRPKQNIVVQ
ncbi:MAG: PAS domain S-box protein [Deltaproteobacteria bacterium]|nr:PAS domain S-box protein [Deltaproteobacteria bacterium]